MVLQTGVCLILTLSIGQPPPPDSLVAPVAADTVSEAEVMIFFPQGAMLPISYQISWGDGETLDWTKPSPYPVEVTRYHRYQRRGDFEIRARARDSLGRTSAWGKPLPIKVADPLPVLKWVFPTFDAVFASPALDRQGNIYFGDDGGWFYSVDTAGHLRWSFQTNGSILGAAAIQGRNVYVPSLDSNLYCLDADGRLRWKINLGDELYTAPAIDGKDNLYVGGDTGTLYSVSSKGQLRWAVTTGDEISSAPSIGLKDLVYVTSDSLYCFDSRGRQRWAFGAPEGDYFFPSAVPLLDGTVLVGNDDGFLYAVGPDGRLRWRAPAPEGDEIRCEVAVGAGDTLFLGTEGWYLCRKDPDRPITTLWELGDILISTPAISSAGTVYSLPDDGYFWAHTTHGRPRWHYEIAGDSKDLYYTSAPTIGPKGTVYVGSWDGGVYAFEGDGPPARTIWPQYRHDAQHTGRLTRPR